MKNFTEKSSNDARINIGYFICEPEVFDFIKEDSDDVQWENGPVVSMQDSCPALCLRVLGLVRSSSQTYGGCCNRFDSHVYKIDGAADGRRETSPALFLRILDLVRSSSQAY